MIYKSCFNIIFLPVILLIGIITSYEDFKISKIRNKWVLAGLSYALFIYLIAWILIATRNHITPFFGSIASCLVWNFDKWCINLAISFFVSYLLWHFKMWGAGDAKLFIVYSALIPMGQYSKVYFNYYFASLFLLLAIFIPASVFIFLRSVYYLRERFEFFEIMEKAVSLIKNNLGWRQINKGIKILVGFFICLLSFNILRQGANGFLSKSIPDQKIIMLLLLFGFRKLSGVFVKNTKVLFILFAVLIIYVSMGAAGPVKKVGQEILSSFRGAAAMMALFPLFKNVVDFYLERARKKNASFAHWMFLGVLIVWFMGAR